jgi:peptidoglycan/xylan/chitin deacetylase (PgdA/CDA1 family)
MALHAPKQLLAVAACTALAFAACTSDRAPSGPVVLGESHEGDPHDHGRTAKVSQDLSSGNFQGTSLPAKTLALTFDDGPGTRTIELSMYLKSVNIKAAFFMNGGRFHAPPAPLVNANSIPITPGGAAILAQLLADGHLVANHTTTHRDLTSEVPDAQRVLEVSDTDSVITNFIAPQNHQLFRAPYGAYNNTVFTTLSASAMNKYTGPIYWEAGGFDTGYPSRAADWACWQGKMKDGGGTLINVGNGAGYATTAQCGDAYVNEIENTFPKGIVLMHDPYSWAQGSTVDMVKYIVPILIGKGYSFVRVDEVPAIAAALPPPPCDPTCATCSGPSANECTACLGGRYKSGGQCLTCSTCGANEYQVSACTVTANTVCGACNAGCATCSGPGANQCTSCAANKYKSGGQCLACSTCSASEYVVSACAATTNTACGACSASCGTCTGPSANECASCTANKFLNGGTCTACGVCGSGTYQATACTPTTDTACAPCDASCTACSGPAANQCGSCPSSFYLNGGACSACKVCDAGTFQATACTTTANAACTACPAGSFTKTAGATTCTKCDPGTTSVAGAKACTPCSAGHIAATAGATTCSACPAGTFAAAGATTCSACAAGTSSGPGAAACTACGSCEDGNACTTDRCDAMKGCVHEPIVGCVTSSGSSGVVAADGGGTDAGTGDTSDPDSGCSVAGAPRRSGSSPYGGVLGAIAALGMSLLVRRRRHPAP